MLRTIHHLLKRRGAASAGHLRDWERRGLFGPLAVLTRRDAARVAREFREQYAQSDNPATRNRHVDLPVLAALCERTGVWERVHEILGDELVLWRTNMFLGNPSLPWHEDHHARLFADEAFSLSMLIAVERSPPDNCTVFVPGSHRLTVSEKERRYGIAARHQDSGNVRYVGRIAPEFREPVPLAAGEAILFHPALLHASSGYVNGEAEPSSTRLSITFRLAEATAELRAEAFPGGVGEHRPRTEDHPPRFEAARVSPGASSRAARYGRVRRRSRVPRVVPVDETVEVRDAFAMPLRVRPRQEVRVLHGIGCMVVELPASLRVSDVSPPRISDCHVPLAPCGQCITVVGRAPFLEQRQQ